jgi:transcriptional regulator with XRE-family HTH domain
MSQQELAFKIGLTQSHVSNLEKNRELPSFYTVEHIAYIFCACPHDLLDFCVDCSMKNKCNRKNFT